MSDIQKESLKVCRAVAEDLKIEFQNQIMAINHNTIIAFSKKNSRLIHSSKDNMGDHQAFYTHATPHRIVIKQKVLTMREGWLGTNWYSLDPIMENGKKKLFGPSKNWKGPKLYGIITLVELMCHELAHNQTKGHAHGFKVKYNRFWDFMVSQILSGKFYVPPQEVEQLKKVLQEVKS